MHHLLRLLHLIAFAAAAAALVYIGASLYTRTGDPLSWSRRDAFAQSVQTGERVIAARNVAGALRLELAAERAQTRHDERLAFLAFGTALLVLIAAVGYVATSGVGGRGVGEQAAA